MADHDTQFSLEEHDLKQLNDYCGFGHTEQHNFLT